MNNTLKLFASLLIILVATSCQQQDSTGLLSDNHFRNEIMDSIANNHDMATQMMDAMMNSEHARMMMMGNEKMMSMMMGNNDMMQNMMKGNPEMMTSMMGMMMNAAEGDSSMQMSMCKKMMENPEMKNMMNEVMMQKDGMADKSSHH